MARILVIEDYRPLLALLQDILEGAGHQVAIAADGRSGLELATRFAPDLALIDLEMPGMDGAEVCTALRAEDATGQLPLLLMSGGPDPQRLARAAAAGVLGLLPKPINPARLQAEIMRGLGVAHPTP